jgi:hypothetical protein
MLLTINKKNNNKRETKMRGKYNLSLEFYTSEEGSSFDELILSLDNLFKRTDGIARIVYHSPAISALNQRIRRPSTRGGLYAL